MKLLKLSFEMNLDSTKLYSRLANFDSEFTIKRIEIFLYRAPIETPVRTSFGVMFERPAIVVRIEDRNGAHGWGEIWCNFPACGAEHRVRLLEEISFNLLINKFFKHPMDLFRKMTKATHVLAIQTGEDGPVSQIIAGIDIAAWDLVARRSGSPIHRLLGHPNTELLLPVYASGISPDCVIETLDLCRHQGYQAFKIKIGFNDNLDLNNVNAAARSLSKYPDCISPGGDHLHNAR